MGRPGYVYLLRLEQDRDPFRCVYKVGRTTDLRSRHKMLGVLMPYPVTLVWAMNSDDAAHTERFVHEQFAGARMDGEWFRLTREQVEQFIAVGMMGEYGEDIIRDPMTHDMIGRIASGEINYDFIKSIEGLYRSAARQ